MHSKINLCILLCYYFCRDMEIDDSRPLVKTDISDLDMIFETFQCNDLFKKGRDTVARKVVPIVSMWHCTLYHKFFIVLILASLLPCLISLVMPIKSSLLL